ncbi:hypothetical protein LV779_15535 [Streptomyces thinghirensis]|nr:hypothetical protein [Streptomyces thinghirensis]
MTPARATSTRASRWTAWTRTWTRTRTGTPLLQDVRTYLDSIGVPETGGEGWEADDDWVTLGGISNTKAVELVLSADWLFTSLARQLKLRKALIQAPVLWELRKLNRSDVAADEAVKAGLDDDCSTGWGQIFAWVTIEARNYCMQQGIINGTPSPTTTSRRCGSNSTRTRRTTSARWRT